MWTNGNWFPRDGDTCHVLYLQVRRCIGDGNCWKLRGGQQWIGRATSTDLPTCTDQGPVIVPIRGTRIESLAMGSVAPAHRQRGRLSGRAHLLHQRVIGEQPRVDHVTLAVA
jgi:hypothetical protein